MDFRIDVRGDGDGDGDLVRVVHLLVVGFGLVDVEVDVLHHFGRLDFGRRLEDVDADFGSVRRET